VNDLLDLDFAPERYELFETPGGLSRRDFFRAGGGVVVALLLGESAAAQRPKREPASQELSAWLHVGEDGAISVFTGKVEIGQNVRTSLAQAVAEELRVPVSRIEMVMADTDRVPFDAGTFGSQTTPQMSAQLRRVGATARELFLDLAAESAKVKRDTLTLKDGKVVGPDGKPSLGLGELSKGKKLVKVVGRDVPLTPPEQWRVAGTSVPKANGRALVTGGHHYASDIKRPGMLHGKVLRPPAFKSALVSVDTKAAAALPGVTVVRDGDFVGVTAPTEHEAAKALAAIVAEWKPPPAQPSSDEIFKYFKEHPTRGGGFGGFGRDARGSVKEGLKAADARIQSSYTIAYIAHVPLEPRAAVAEWGDGKLTVWTGTQRPFGVRGELMSAFGLAADKVRVIVPDTGSGYGGKHAGEAALEAAKLARASKCPVKLVWTRAEEFTWAYARPGGVIEVAAGAKKDGTLHAWEFNNYNSGASALRTYYEVPNVLGEFHAADSPLRQGSYRALAATANHFARECAMDELAHELKLDPLAFRLKNLKDERLRTVLEAAAKQFGWGKAKPAEGRGFGIAVGTEKGSCVATAAEVAADAKTGKVKVLRLVAAFDCGTILNPDHLKCQIEGALVQGLGGALFEEVRFAGGKILNADFAGYRLPRFGDAPETIEVVLIDRKGAPSNGAGETPIVCVAPAVGNAIFAAIGVRIRSLPMLPGLKAM
jgi:nicotinate dehydrogenase subunit B